MPQPRTPADRQHITPAEFRRSLRPLWAMWLKSHRAAEAEKAATSLRRASVDSDLAPP